MQVFPIAFDKRRRFNPTSNFAGTWLYGIATNVMRHHVRKEVARLRIPAVHLLEVYETDPDVTHRLDAQRAGSKLASAVATLPHHQREVSSCRPLKGCRTQRLPRPYRFRMEPFDPG